MLRLLRLRGLLRLRTTQSPQRLLRARRLLRRLCSPHSHNVVRPLLRDRGGKVLLRRRLRLTAGHDRSSSLLLPRGADRMVSLLLHGCFCCTVAPNHSPCRRSTLDSGFLGTGARTPPASTCTGAATGAVRGGRPPRCRRVRKQRFLHRGIVAGDNVSPHHNHVRRCCPPLKGRWCGR